MTEAELYSLLAQRQRTGRIPALGIMGGTFDPIHVGHIALGEAARDELDLDGVLYIPAGNPSFKQDRTLAPAAVRTEMVELALKDVPDSAVSLLEIDRPGVTYTIDTLRELRGIIPSDTRLVFIMGADSLSTLYRWNQAAEIARLTEFAVGTRSGESIDEACMDLARHDVDATIHLLERPLPDVSSTMIRQRVEHGEDISGLVAPAVQDLIERCGLYRAYNRYGR